MLNAPAHTSISSGVVVVVTRDKMKSHYNITHEDVIKQATIPVAELF